VIPSKSDKIQQVNLFLTDLQRARGSQAKRSTLTDGMQVAAIRVGCALGAVTSRCGKRGDGGERRRDKQRRHARSSATEVFSGRQRASDSHGGVSTRGAVKNGCRRAAAA
jgi:hypothetical protein